MIMSTSWGCWEQNTDNWKVHLEVLITLDVLCKGFVKEVIKKEELLQ